jgi:hypothetical protein
MWETRIRYTRLFNHLVGDDLAGGVDEVGESSGRCSHRLMDSDLRKLGSKLYFAAKVLPVECDKACGMA